MSGDENLVPGERRGLLREAYPHPVWSVFAILLLFVLSGVSMQILPVAAPAILQDWDLAGTALAAPIAAVLLGSAIGTVGGGVASDILGRRVLIILSIVLLGAFVALSALAVEPWHLTGTMLGAGIAMGGFFAPGMALVTEISPPQRRALAISLTVASLPAGLTLCSLTAAALLPILGWKTMFVLAGALALPVLLLFVLFAPESPGFLAANPARANELQRVVERLSLEPIEAPVAGEKPPPLSRRFAQLAAAAPIATMSLFALFLVTNLFGNVVLGWIPTVYAELGFSISFASGAMASWTTAMLVMTPVAGWLLGRFGLHLVCPVSIVITGGALVLLGFWSVIEAPQALVYALLALGGLGAAGIVTSLYSLAAESFPSQMRASGIGICDAIGRAGGVLGAYAGAYLIAFGGASGFFYLLAGLMGLNLLILLLLLGTPQHKRA